MNNGNISAELDSSSARALVVGASGRMAASMLTSLGIECSIADLYGDFDSQLITNGRVTKMNSLAELSDLESLIRQHDFTVFAGGLEGNPNLASKISKWTKPAFTSAVSLPRLSDVEVWNRATESAGLSQARLYQDQTHIRWPAVAKDPKHSGTALLVKDAEMWAETSERGYVLQELLNGDSVSAIFVSDGGKASFIGGSIQLVDSFSWIGSICGLELSNVELETTLKFANALTAESGLKGVFGIDFVRGNDALFPVDVNPRIAASAEIVGNHVMKHHLKAFGIELDVDAPQTDTPLHGKLVIFNPSDQPLTFSHSLLSEFKLRFESSPGTKSIADVPHDAESILPGAPVMTVFASGDSVDQVKKKLRSMELQILQSLGVRKPLIRN